MFPSEAAGTTVLWTATIRQRKGHRQRSGSRTSQLRFAVREYCQASRRTVKHPKPSCRLTECSFPPSWRTVGQSTPPTSKCLPSVLSKTEPRLETRSIDRRGPVETSRSQPRLSSHDSWQRPRERLRESIAPIRPVQIPAPEAP